MRLGDKWELGERKKYVLDYAQIWRCEHGVRCYQETRLQPLCGSVVVDQLWLL